MTDGPPPTIDLVYALLSDVKVQIERIDGRFTDELAETRRELVELQREMMRSEARSTAQKVGADAAIAAQKVALETLASTQRTVIEEVRNDMRKLVSEDQLARDYMPRREQDRNRRETSERRRYWPMVVIGVCSAMPGLATAVAFLSSH